MRVLANILSEQACAEMVITGQCRPCAVSSAAGKCSRESDGGPGTHVRRVCPPSDDLTLAGTAGSGAGQMWHAVCGPTASGVPTAHYGRSHFGA